MSIKTQNMAEIREFYTSRFETLAETIKKVCFKIESDELISTLSEDSDCQQFIMERIKEIFDEFIAEDRKFISLKFSEKFNSEKHKEKNEAVDRLNYCLEEANQLTNDLKKKNGDYQVKVEELQAKIEGLMNKLGESEAEKLRLEAMVEDLREKICGLVENTRKEEENYQETISKTFQIESEQNDLLIRISSLEALKNESESMFNQQKSDLLSQIESLKSQNQQLSDKFAECQSNLKKKTVLIDKITQSKRKYKAKVAQMAEDIGKFESLDAELEVLRGENRNLEEKLIASETSLEEIQREMAKKYEEILEYSNGETFKRCEIERRLEMTIEKVRFFSQKISLQMKDLKEMMSVLFKGFAPFSFLEPLLDSTKKHLEPLMSLRSQLQELNRRNEEIALFYSQKLDSLEENQPVKSDSQTKILALSRKLKKTIEVLTDSQTKIALLEEEIKSLRKSSYSTRIQLEEKVYRLEKELSNRPQASRKEENPYQNLQKKYRCHNLLKNGEETEKAENDCEENPVKPSLKVGSLNVKPNKRQLSLKEL